MQPLGQTTKLKTHHHLQAAFPKWLLPIFIVLRPGWYITHQLATEPRWQFVFNAFFSVFWLIVMWFVTTLKTFQGPSNLSGLLIMEVSLWANFISHYGALGANVAAIIAGQMRQKNYDI